MNNYIISEPKAQHKINPKRKKRKKSKKKKSEKNKLLNKSQTNKNII